MLMLVIIFFIVLFADLLWIFGAFCTSFCNILKVLIELQVKKIRSFSKSMLSVLSKMSLLLTLGGLKAELWWPHASILTFWIWPLASFSQIVQVCLHSESHFQEYYSNYWWKLYSWKLYYPIFFSVTCIIYFIYLYHI